MKSEVTRMEFDAHIVVCALCVLKELRHNERTVAVAATTTATKIVIIIIVVIIAATNTTMGTCFDVSI